MRFGLILANRSVAQGTGSAGALVDLALAAESSDHIDSVWVGDSLYVNPRLESVTLLAAIASRTSRVLLGPACMGSIALRDPLVLAAEWASLDHLSGGRMVMIACAGGGKGPDWEAESAAMGVEPAERRRRMTEHVRILRHLWHTDGEAFEGEFHRFEGLRLRPKPLQEHCPIWMATNAKRLNPEAGSSDGVGRDVPIGLQRVAAHADGWMTHSTTPEAFADSWTTINKLAADAGRDTSRFGNCLYHNIAIGPDRATALAQAQAFLEDYYETSFSLERTAEWTTAGTPEQCIEELRRWEGSGVQRIALRLCGPDQPGLLDQVVRDVLPHAAG